VRFDKKQEIKETIERADPKRFAKEILKQPERFAFLIDIFNELPVKLTKCFQSYLKSRRTTQYVEVEIIGFIISDFCFPGDIFIRTNRYPKLNDFVEILYGGNTGYHESISTVTQINLKKGTINLQGAVHKDHKDTTNISNITEVVDKIIVFGTPEWKNMLKTLNIDFDKKRIIYYLECNIEHLNKVKDFHRRKENLDKLKQRLKEVKIYKD